MARLHFRVFLIALDEDEEVRAIQAVVDADALALIRKAIGEVTVIDSRRGGTEATIELRVGEVVDLFNWCGKQSGVSPERKFSNEIWESLSAVVYGWIEAE